MVSVRRGSMLRDEQAIDPAKIGMADSLAQLQVASMTQKEDLVLFHGTHLLTSHKRSLGDQVWSVMEKVLVAALEYGQDSWAVSCASALVNRFPSSNRVSRLIGMAREAAGDWEEATNIYTDLLKGNPADTLTRKRLITVFISQRRYHEAIEALNAHLEEFAVDAEAWQVLGAIYLAEHRPLYASYCFEELLLHNPRSLYHVITYAEVQASLGHRLLAHKYFALALAIDGENPRALWGLVLVRRYGSRRLYTRWGAALASISRSGHSIVGTLAQSSCISVFELDGCGRKIRRQRGYIAPTLRQCAPNSPGSVACHATLR
eukprot:GHVT01006072.1.p1 GENE.GHVT01006072.1~~GHVT01006072.1.p1  ORF type:complete len:319 (-),score=33.60 GHVT01006072.1:1246-2202(-)